MKNQTKPPHKMSLLEKQMNKALIFQFLFLGIIIAFSAAFQAFWTRANGAGAWYLMLPERFLGLILNAVGTFVVLYSLLIPISLYICMELARLAMAFFINNDAEMVDKENRPAHAKTTGIVEDLGQIDYIFADKTGTLTVNVMNFRAASIGGKIYGEVPKLGAPKEDEAKDSSSKPKPKSKKGPHKSHCKHKHDRWQVQWRETDNRRPGGDQDEEEASYQFHDESLIEDAKGEGKSDSKSGGKSDAKDGEVNVVREWIQLLAVCHSTIPEKDEGEQDNDKNKKEGDLQIKLASPKKAGDKSGKSETPDHEGKQESNSEDLESIRYQATSPDEKALVIAAKHLGFIFHSRKSDKIVVNIFGKDEEFQILCMLEFTSDRKRMSVICKTPEGKLRLYCKGADSMIFERLRDDQSETKDAVEKDLKKFAESGLRTLAMAYKDLEEEEFNSWNEKYQEALTSLEDREENIGKVAEEIEKDLILLGGSGIEDKLQDDVPHVLARLKKANIKIWVLTGDKRETAVNIGYSCSLFSQDSELVTINSTSEGDISKQIKEGLSTVGDKKKDNKESKNGGKIFGLVVEGKSLDFCLNEKNVDKFLELAKKCESVVVCRVSPLQKSSVVKSVKSAEKGIKALAIGDGANDVSMIQASDVGVAIRGKEGTQAVRSCDFAIGEFRFLEKLLIVHGRWAYKRLAKLVLYSFYKNMTFNLILFWYNLVYSVGSGQNLFDTYSLAMYNALFTFAPIMCFAILEQDVKEDKLNEFPQLYYIGQKRKEFHMRLFCAWAFDGVVESAIICFGIVLIFGDGIISQNGLNFGIWSFGILAYSIALITVTIKVASEITYWTRLHIFAIVFSLGSWFGWLLIVGLIPIFYLPEIITGDLGNIYKVALYIYQTPVFWLSMLVIPVAALLPHFFYKQFKRMVYPHSVDVVNETRIIKKHEDREYHMINS